MKSTALSGKSTLITGASTGIGRATARLFAKAGSDLVLLARSRGRLEELASELKRECGVRADVLVLDVTDVSKLRDSLAKFTERHAVDIAIVNAGIGQYGPFHSSPWRDIETVLRTNVDGALATVHALTPRMVSRRSGSLVLISSVLGKRAIPWNTVYCASKHALQGFADGLRLELRKHGIHVGVVCPARTDTEFFNSMVYSAPQKRERKVPVSPPEAVARAVLSCVLRGRREVVVSAGGKAFAAVGYHFPRISDLIMNAAVPDHVEV